MPTSSPQPFEKPEAMRFLAVWAVVKGHLGLRGLWNRTVVARSVAHDIEKAAKKEQGGHETVAAIKGLRHKR
jgi:hypothetical protein